LREITARNIASGKFPRVSKIEDVVANELTKLGITFERQYGIRDPTTGRYRACVDFFLPDKQSVIEVNGTFWHADPRFYEHAQLTQAQLRTIDRYSEKVNLLRESGLKLIEIWEFDITKDAPQAVRKAIGL